MSRNLSPEGEQLIRLLARLEQELRSSQLWGDASPTDSALQSLAPFACDAMSFFEWFQWLCVPRLQEVASDRRNRLPVASEITVAAEIYLQQEGRAEPALMALMQALDDELNARWVSGCNN